MAVPPIVNTEAFPEYLFRFVEEDRSPINTSGGLIVSRGLCVLAKDKKDFSKYLSEHGRKWSETKGPFISTTSNAKWALKRAKEEEYSTGKRYLISVIRASVLREIGASVWHVPSTRRCCSLEPLVWTENEYILEHFIPAEAIHSTLTIEDFKQAKWIDKQKYPTEKLSLRRNALSSVQNLEVLLVDQAAMKLGREVEELRIKLRSAHQRYASLSQRIADLETKVSPTCDQNSEPKKGFLRRRSFGGS